MITDKNTPIQKRSDGDYLVPYNGGFYGVKVGDDECYFPYSKIEAYLAEHPESLINEPVPPEPTAEGKASVARHHRDTLLAACDWTQVADAPVDQAAWKTYRQALRDWPGSAGFPDIATLPESPPK